MKIMKKCKKQIEMHIWREFLCGLLFKYYNMGGLLMCIKPSPSGQQIKHWYRKPHLFYAYLANIWRKSLTSTSTPSPLTHTIPSNFSRSMVLAICWAWSWCLVSEEYKNRKFNLLSMEMNIWSLPHEWEIQSEMNHGQKTIKWTFHGIKDISIH